MDFFHFEMGDTPTKTSLVDLHIKASVNSAIFLAIHAVLLSVVYAIRDKEKWFEEMVTMTNYILYGRNCEFYGVDRVRLSVCAMAILEDGSD